MLWPREEFLTAYNQIKHDSIQHGGCSILILVAMDVDALCASEILTQLLKADFLSFSLVAVHGYDDIQRIGTARFHDEDGMAREDTDLRSIILINCGAIVDVSSLFQLPMVVKCYILDSHRPIHLSNIYNATKQIIVFEDGGNSMEAIPEDGSDLDMDEFDDSSDEECVEHAVKVDSQEVEFEAQEVEITETALEEGVNDAESGETKENGPSSDKTEKRRRREEILRYYRGSYFGAPVATIAFELAQQLNSSHSDLIWYAILGLTKQFLLEQIDMDDYNLLIHFFQDEILTLEPSSTEAGTEFLEGRNLHGNPGTIAQPPTLASNPAYRHEKITFEEEYRFMLYRHWSLYDSMYYSDYIASKLGLYMSPHPRSSQNGNAYVQSGSMGNESALHVWLARMGFSLKRSQQMYMYMPLQMKTQLREKTQELAQDFGLQDLCYGSFQRQYAFQYHQSAADAVYGLQALLEAPASCIMRNLSEQKKRQSQKTSFGGGTSFPHSNLSDLLTFVGQDSASLDATTSAGTMKDDGVIAPQGTEDSLQERSETSSSAPENGFWQQNFIVAHTALSRKSVLSSSLMETGIHIAMEIKQAIVRVGRTILERKLIRRVKHFRYVSLSIPERDQELFWNGNVLTQLSLFLLSMYRASGRWLHDPHSNKRQRTSGDQSEEDQESEKIESAASKQIVPLILITQHPSRQCFLVVGVTCPPSAGQVYRNTLGTAFRLAAEETSGQFRQDGFTSAVMELQIQDIFTFIEQLHNVLDA
uniref:Cell division control protein 45 putative n=1 Tax=Albugo laibachii Nc14 TaxID=890382 RepID=F0W4U5_9STRA|nr:cell division control protein 45 putative [Albugo laibachii Nc14]CCA25094.1 cell division control protein 45 putative [Albugo laibachii Nc14]|eukprot:CCA25094.1 cell division control protein 45 putative [Albugo laibachii Nc14]